MSEECTHAWFERCEICAEISDLEFKRVMIKLLISIATSLEKMANPLLTLPTESEGYWICHMIMNTMTGDREWILCTQLGPNHFDRDPTSDPIPCETLGETQYHRFVKNHPHIFRENSKVCVTCGVKF